MPPPKSIKNVLQDSPLLSTEEIKVIFPTKADQDALLSFAKAVHESVERNLSTAQAWAEFSKFKDVAITVLRKAIGVPF